MKTSYQRQNNGKWLPLLALPFLLVVCFILWIALAPSATVPAQGVGILPGFPGALAAGSYLALFLVHLVMFLLLRGYRANLLFSFACLIWLLRIGMQMPDVFPLLSPSPESFIGSRLVFVALPLISVLMLGVFRRLFPSVLQKWFVYTVNILMAAFAFVFLILGGNLLHQAITACVGALCLAGAFMIIRLIYKIRKIGPEHVTFLLGSAIFIHGVVYALLLSSDSLPLAIRYLNHNYVLIFSFFVSAALLIATTREVLDSNAERQRIAAQEIITENQLDFQREQFGRLMENMESARYMRHDMKHHLAVISEYVSSENVSGIRGYLEGLELGLTAARGKFHCENYAVNAIVNHYLNFAESDGVSLKIKLTVPVSTGRVRENDLCVIVGNFLENAVEACRSVPKGERFIRLFSYVQDDILTFTMENSFDEDLKEWGGVFYSTKRDGEGVGLSSVQAVTERYGGSARFEAKGNVFLSSAYVDIGEF